MILIRVIFFGAGLLGLIGLGCKQKDEPRAQAHKHSVLRMGMPGEPESLDPQHVFGNAANTIVSNLFEGLVIEHPSDDEAVLPGVAYQWECSPDGLRWTFYLRKEAVWSNGDPVSAHDFVFSYWRLLHPGNLARFADMMYPIKNARAFNKGEIDNFSAVGVKAIDDHTLVLELEYPAPYLLTSLTNFYALPVHEKTLETAGAVLGPQSRWARAGTCVGNGPFVLEEHTPYKQVILRSNPTYWDAKTVRLSEIHFFPFEDHNAEERAFRSGKIHFCSRVPQSKIDTYLIEAPEFLHMDNYLSTYLYRINTQLPPFDNVLVRQALALSIDRALLVDKVTQGAEIAANAYIPPVFPGYTSLAHVEYNPQKARKLLAQAGFPQGQGMPTIEILYNTSSNHRAVAETIQQMWQKELGLTCSLRNEEWRVYLSSLDKCNYMTARAQWIGSFVDLSAMLDPWRGASVHNKTGWKNPQYDALIDQANSVMHDSAARNALMAQAEKILLDEMPLIPIFWNRRIYLLSPKVKGWRPKLTDSRPYKYIYLED